MSQYYGHVLALDATLKGTPFRGFSGREFFISFDEMVNTYSQYIPRNLWDISAMNDGATLGGIQSSMRFIYAPRLTIRANLSVYLLRRLM